MRGKSRSCFPPMRIRRTPDGLFMINGRGTGGTTTISCGNGLRMDRGLKELGIDLDAEFDELAERNTALHGTPGALAAASTRRLYEAFRARGLDPRPIPKLGNSSCAGDAAAASWAARTA